MMAFNSVLVTGSNRGIGLELVRQFSAGERQPKFIFAACRNPSSAQDLQKLAGDNASIHIIALDIDKEETYKTACQEVENHVGDSGLDMLINNAATLIADTLDQVTTGNLTRTFQVNAVGPLMLAKTFLPLIKMAANKSCQSSKQAIINISSVLSVMKTRIMPGAQYSYKIAKTALNSISVQLADDLKSEGIIVISLCPGWVKTDMGGAAALLTPQQSVSGILELLSKLSIENSGKFYRYSGETLEW